MHTLLIVEDDPFISRSIAATFKEKPFEVLGIAKSVSQARELLELQKPDVCLVDIQLKGEESGTALAADLDLLQIPYLYLTAQTDPYTLAEVSRTNPLGYIVKPFTLASLWSSFSVSWQQYISKQKTIFTVKVDGYLYKIDEADILYLEAFDNYCYLHTTNKKLLLPRTLKSVRESLHASYYFTPHRSYLINLKKVTNLGKRTVEVSGRELPLSEARRPELLKILK
ncbi:LytR/AlgR family response regulator transcription factor [Patiriisocius hiemis]|uniref:Response regulator transcription factor n=1 Tax=Patiriisocius hiemis TaxID=3075604 RepID=A0ABU2YFM9_9FLAO|nr:response regulator transcription factor [Constantimarinum sp. W242]MDT0556676.1 response regulator transcription factor [Constantimarinum sp. W242]